jgi:uncharacterized damage-inducible protein DinB
MKQMLLSFCRYNLWANKQLLDAIQLMPRDIIDASVPNSFTSIRKTIYHIWDAQVIWLGRLQGISLSTWPSAEYDNDFAGFDLYFIRQCEDFIQFVETRNEGYFESTCFYKAINGKDHQTRTGDIILHCMNHGTYHRGQIITMLRNLEVTELPTTDFIFYLRAAEENNLPA